MSTLPELHAKITGVFVGKVENHWPGKAPSAIAKHFTSAELNLQPNGFVEDMQADLKVHGGTEKAVHHYAAEHMDHWRLAFPDHADQFVPGCFGENISTTGLNEQNLCLGDILPMGTAKVQICQGRQPCRKLNAHTGIDQMAGAFQRSARTGWYYRVLESGQVKFGDTIRLIERPHADWCLDRLIKARFNPKTSRDDATELANNPAISQSWRQAFKKKQNRDFQEDTAPRLIG